MTMQYIIDKTRAKVFRSRNPIKYPHKILQFIDVPTKLESRLLRPGELDLPYSKHRTIESSGRELDLIRQIDDRAFSLRDTFVPTKGLCGSTVACEWACNNVLESGLSLSLGQVFLPWQFCSVNVLCYGNLCWYDVVLAPITILFSWPCLWFV